MASLYRPRYSPPGKTFAEAKADGTLRESSVWWVKYRAADSTLRRESTGQRDRAAALETVQILEAAVAQERLLKPPCGSARKLAILPATVPPRPKECARCSKESARLVRDHDHATGHFRGWLCASCNVLVGYYEHRVKAKRETALTFAYLTRAHRDGGRALSPETIYGSAVSTVGLVRQLGARS